MIPPWIDVQHHEDFVGYDAVPPHLRLAQPTSATASWLSKVPWVRGRQGRRVVRLTCRKARKAFPPALQGTRDLRRSHPGVRCHWNTSVPAGGSNHASKTNPSLERRLSAGQGLDFGSGQEEGTYSLKLQRASEYCRGKLALRCKCRRENRSKHAMHRVSPSGVMPCHRRHPALL